MNLIIVGASSGIGREVALLFLESGHRVGIAARRTDKLQELCERFPEQAVAAQIDVCAADAPERLRALIEQMGGIELYFHAAGIGKQNMALAADIENATLQTNGVGFTAMIGEAFRYFAAKPEGGHIGIISSIAGTRGLGAAPSYSATKAFQNTYIEALAQQAAIRRLPITFTDIRPGFVNTPLLDDGKNYPLMLKPESVAKDIYRSLLKKRSVRIIDWKYRLLVPLWRCIPHAIWRKLRIQN